MKNENTSSIGSVSLHKPFLYKYVFLALHHIHRMVGGTAIHLQFI